MPRKISLTPDEAAVLDESFIAQLEVDIAELQRLRNLLPRDSRPEGIAENRERLAKPVSVRLNQELRGVSHRLHKNGIPRRFKEREAFMHAVEEVLREQFSDVGGSLSDGAYEVFVNPVRQEESSDEGGAPSHLGLFEKWMHTRPGAWLADQRSPEHVDTAHHYLELFRQDMLDYESGDFYSIRRLRGRNTSRRPSFGVPYRESSENAFTCEDAGVTAFDCRTRETLEVEFEERAQRSHTHAFTIHFANAIAPGETFDVVYNIRLPGELNELRHPSEVMSISLVRIAQGIDKLVFNVATSFKPTAAAAYNLTGSGDFVACAGRPPKVEPYMAERPKNWFESSDVFGIEWSCEQPYIIRWQASNPMGRMYVVNFRGADPNNPLVDRGR